MEEEKVSRFDVQPNAKGEFLDIREAFHYLMDQHYKGEGHNPWVIAEVNRGHFEVLTEEQAWSREDVINWYILQFNPSGSVTLSSWMTGRDFITILEDE